MKTKLLLILSLLASTLSNYSVALSWIPIDSGYGPVVYRIYEVSGTNRTLVATSPMGSIFFDLGNPSPGRHDYVVTATNQLAESPPSNVATLYVPVAPTGLKLIVSPSVTNTIPLTTTK